jgi:hypothetical protein
MGRGLLILGALGTLGLGASGAIGYGLLHDPGESIRVHVLVGLGACLVVLFSHAWILLYLLGTGRLIRQAVKEHGLEESVLDESARLRGRGLFGLVLLALAAVFATFVLGNTAFAGSTPIVLHHGLFWAGLAVQLWALARERRVLAANERLIAGLDRRLAAAAHAG